MMKVSLCVLVPLQQFVLRLNGSGLGIRIAFLLFLNPKSAFHILKSVNTIIPPTNSTGHKKCHHAFAGALYPKLSDQQE
jgi:hypothetical protein